MTAFRFKLPCWPRGPLKLLWWCATAFCGGADAWAQQSAADRMPAVATAQMPNAETAIDWPALRSLVLESSPTLHAQRMQWQGARAAIDSARAWPNPELEYMPGRQQARSADALSGASSAWGASLRVENPWLRGGRIDAARYGGEAAGLAYQALVNDVLADARKRLLELALRLEEEKLAEDSLGDLLQIRKRVEVRVNSGEVARFELVKADTEVLNARQRLSSARARTERARVGLVILTGGTWPKHAVPRASLDDLSPPPLQEFTEQIANQHPELRRMHADWQRAQALIEVERGNVLPHLQLRVTRRQQPDTHSTEAGLALSVPLFDRRAGPIAEAQAEAQRLRVQFDGRLKELQQLALATQQDYNLARERVLTLETGVVREAQNAVKIAETSYRFGERALLEVLDAQRVLRAARAELLDARYAVQQAAIELERLRGAYAEPLATLQ